MHAAYSRRTWVDRRRLHHTRSGPNAEPTVTDANVVLQTLNPTHLLGGRMAVRQDLAREAIGRLAEKLSLPPCTL